MTHEAIISLGSNTDKKILELATILLAETFQLISQSEIIESNAIGEHYQSPFYNQAIKLLSGYEKDETIQIFKETEIKLGRTPQSKSQGIVPLDIDLIIWEGVVYKDDYYRFDFVRKCVDEIK